MAREKKPSSPARVSANPSPGEGPRTSEVEPSTCGLGNISSASEVSESVGKKNIYSLQFFIKRLPAIHYI